MHQSLTHFKKARVRKNTVEGKQKGIISELVIVV